MNIYLNILKGLLQKDLFNRFYVSLPLDFISKNFPEISKVYLCLPRLHNVDSVGIYSIDDLELTFYSEYPKADTGLYTLIFKELRATEASLETIVMALESIKARDTALKVAQTALKASEGLNPLSDILPYLDEINEAPEAEWQFVEDDLEKIYAQESEQPGLRWRLGSLNRALGSLRKGTFGFVFARPETGKTTFLASETTYMAEQVTADDGPIIWFNNEQPGNEVKKYCWRACLGLTEDQVRGTMGEVKAQYFSRTKGKHWIYDDGALSKQTVEAICRQYKPSLIIFDQIDHLKGFQADRNDLELKEIYTWARELAKKYCPVIGICQAGGSGEGKKWLTMNDVDNSKTGKQGAADWILGIGATNEIGQEYLRHFHLSKNKLSGDKDTDPSMRHGRWGVLIKPEITRYIDLHEAQ